MAAVQSMRLLNAMVHLDSDSSLQSVCASPLSRHVGGLAVSTETAFPIDQLPILSHRLHHLHSLECTFSVEWAPLVFPMRLRRLNVCFASSLDSEDEPSSNAQLHELDAAIRVIAALPRLEELTLDSRTNSKRCCLMPLVSAPALRVLKLGLGRTVLEAPNVIEALRRMPHLRSLCWNPSPAAFARLLRTPHAMRIDTMSLVFPITAKGRASVAHLSSLRLTDLTIDLRCGDHTDVFYQLPHLHRLVLDARLVLFAVPDTKRIMASMIQLSALTELTLNGGRSLRFTSGHLAACFSRMPCLAHMHLSDAVAVDSLRFHSSGPITRSLKTLWLTWLRVRLPLSELLHVHVLSSLTELHLSNVFDRPLDASLLRLYQPPSLAMPALSYFHHDWEATDEG
jgi:hypothetical protein